MKVGIVGAGFTGLAAGYELVKAGCEVTIFEKRKDLGGLASGFKPLGWQWELEKYYHHIFAGDRQVIALAKEVGWPAFFSRPLTNSLIENEEKQLDSPLSLLRFDSLSFWSRVHMGAGLAMLKLMRQKSPQAAEGSELSFTALRTAERSEPFFAWFNLERYRVVDVLPKLVGLEAYKKVWEPLLMAKFGRFLPKVNMAWFWARVNKRTAELGYFKGGFGKLAEKLAEEVKRRGGEMKKLQITNYKLQILNKGFDKVLFTTPAPIVNGLLGKKAVRWPKIDYLWGQTLALELDDKLMDGYWLNVLEKDWPFLVVVEQTNFIDKKYYGGKRVVYLGNYLENKDKRLRMGSEELLTLYLPYIKKINPDFRKSWIKRKWRFQNPYAQPVFPVNYSGSLPSIKTRIPGVYVANMSMVYPWDRGVNFAVELGQRAAKEMVNDA